MFSTACPAAPLYRLSKAPTTMIRFVLRSTVQPTPRVFVAVKNRLSTASADGYKRTNGSLPYIVRYAFPICSSVTPFFNVAVQVARIPHFIGTRCGVNCTITGCAATKKVPVRFPAYDGGWPLRTLWPIRHIRSITKRFSHRVPLRLRRSMRR